MTTKAGAAASDADLDAALQDYQRKAAALARLARARERLASQQWIQRELIRRRKKHVEECEQECRECGALPPLAAE